MTSEKYGLIVVGSGAAGLAAANSFVDCATGRRVAVLEVSAREDRGGATRWTTARFRVDEADRLDPFVIGKVEEVSGGLVDLEYFRAFEANVPATLRFIQDAGVELTGYGPPVATEIQHEKKPNGGGYEVVEKLAARLEQSADVDLFYNTEAVRLLTDEKGRINGVAVRDGDGLLRNLSADAVVLACGGFEGNPEMLSRYLGNNACDFQLLAPGLASNTGAGIRMAMEQGAGTAGQFDMVHSELVDRRTDRADAVIYGHTFGIVVNDKAERFYDEGQACFDQTFELIAFEVWKNQRQSAFFIADQTIAAYPNIMVLFDTDMPPIEADTIEELADQLGLDPDALAMTVAEYNQATNDVPFDPMTLDGKCTTGLSPEKSNWAYPLRNGPFFAYPLKSAICFTYGGLRVDARARVLTSHGTALPGLYAAGEIAGAFYHEYPAGTSVLRSLTFGRIAGRDAASQISAPAAA